MKYLVTIQSKNDQVPSEPVLLDTQFVSLSEFVAQNISSEVVIIFRSLQEVRSLAPEP